MAEEPITLYQAPVCPYSRRTRMVLEHLGAEYKAVEVDLDDLPKGFEKVSPDKTTPAIVHGTENLWDSNTINEYLAETYESDLLPDTKLGRARMHANMRFSDEEWMPLWNRLVKTTGGETGGSKDEGIVRKEVLEMVRRMEDILFYSPGPYFQGDAPTLGDFAFASTLPLVMDEGVQIPKDCPKITRWVETISQSPAWKAVPKEYEKKNRVDVIEAPAA
ncbi:MAG: glutathione S-transferase family protein [Euryarchaeota archaeon]|nr:glutathione S-transferase family protein [Euryarchaeota archaeon]